MRSGDVVDELHDEDGLADTGAAEQAGLAALDVQGQQIDDLDAGLRIPRPVGVGSSKLGAARWIGHFSSALGLAQFIDRLHQ